MKYKLGIVEWALPPMGPYLAKMLKELGLQGMELDFGEYEEGYRLSNRRIQEAYLECAEAYGFEYPSMALNALNTHGMSHDRNSVDGMIAIETIKKGIQAAKEMNIPVVQLPSFHSGDIRTEKDFYNTCEKLRLACELSSGTDMILAMENVLDAEQTLKMIDEVGCDRVKVFFDTQNYHIDRGYSEPEILAAIAEHVIQVHVKDGFNKAISSAPLGKGDASFLETAEVIKRTNCTEWLFIENFYHWQPLSLMHDDMFELLKADIQTLEDLFGDIA